MSFDPAWVELQCFRGSAIDDPFVFTSGGSPMSFDGITITFVSETLGWDWASGTGLTIDTDAASVTLAGATDEATAAVPEKVNEAPFYMKFEPGGYPVRGVIRFQSP